MLCLLQEEEEEEEGGEAAHQPAGPLRRQDKLGNITAADVTE